MCNVTNNHYVGIVRDKSRAVQAVQEPDFKWPLAFVLIPLFLVGFGGPYIAYRLDVQGRDFKVQTERDHAEMENVLEYLLAISDINVFQTFYTQKNFLQLQH